jgi:hypothetical protein
MEENMRILKNLILLTLVSLFIISNVKSQDDEVPERLKYYKEKYEEEFTAPFVTIWNSVKEAIESTGCQITTQKYAQNEEGYYKGTIKTDYCVFAEGPDTTYRECQKYQLDMPYIPGGNWVNGRINYKIMLKEIGDGKVSMVLTSDMSGYEAHVTFKVHFWKSNGILEHFFIENLKKIIAKNTKP